MKKFFMGLMLSCVVMFSFSVVGNCMTQQTVNSVYLHIEENSWFKLKVERKAQDNPYINLPRDWYKKVWMPSKTIVDKRPPMTAEDSPILVKEVLQEPRDFNLYIPIEGGFFGPEVASFNVKLKNNNKSIEEIVNEKNKPKQIIEAKFMNVVCPGKTYEDEVIAMERQLDVQTNFSQILNSADVKIIPFNMGIRSCGYIFTSNLDGALENALIYFTRGGYGNNQFNILKTFLDDYWQNMGLKARVRKFHCPR
jgi:hypothetical protein